MDSVSSGQFEIRVKAFDETEFLRGVQKLANRVTMGLVLAAMIVGAAMLMRVDTSSKLFGYPTIAMITFLAALLGAGFLLVSIVLNDRGINKRTRRKRRR
jgi:ubiquinone biosynthesis protein